LILRALRLASAQVFDSELVDPVSHERVADWPTGSVGERVTWPNLNRQPTREEKTLKANIYHYNIRHNRHGFRREPKVSYAERAVAAGDAS
jgi:hypothetical protein